jgi:hypothetical protein
MRLSRSTTHVTRDQDHPRRTRRRSRARWCAIAAIPVAATLAGSGVAGAHLTSGPVAHTAGATFNNGGENLLACPSANECIAVDGGGTAYTFNPTRKSKVTHSRAVPVTAPNQQLALACASSALCVEADAAGEVGVFDPKRPTKKPATFTVTGGLYQTTLSCPSHSRCVVETYSGEAVFNPGHPGSPTTAAFTANGSGGDPIISCPSATLCAGANGTGNNGQGQVYTYNPLHPAAAVEHTFKSTPEVGPVHCVNTSFCVALAARNGDSNLGAVAFNPRKPGNPGVTTISLSTLETLTCASKTLCAAAGYDDGVYIFNPQHPKKHKHFVAFPYNITAVGIAFIGSSKLVALSYTGQKVVINPRKPPKSVKFARLGQATKVK